MKPNVGMLHPVAARVATYTKGSAITYSAGAVIAEARGATLTWNRADGHFYGEHDHRYQGTYGRRHHCSPHIGTFLADPYTGGNREDHGHNGPRKLHCANRCQ